MHYTPNHNSYVLSTTSEIFSYGKPGEECRPKRTVKHWQRRHPVSTNKSAGSSPGAFSLPQPASWAFTFYSLRGLEKITPNADKYESSGFATIQVLWPHPLPIKINKHWFKCKDLILGKTPQCVRSPSLSPPPLHLGTLIMFFKKEISWVEPQAKRHNVAFTITSQ